MLHICSELSKARLSSLVVFTSGAGYLMAGAPGSWIALGAVSIGTALAAAAAGTFNQVWERHLDSQMKRTQGRPLPAGDITPAAATAFGGFMTAASAATLLAGTNPVTAALGMGNIALYALVYTPLKTRSELSTAVGAVVGAVPPVMGWAAASGGDLFALEPLLLGLTLFWWQFPHFYSLGWTLRRDYTRGGYAMVPTSDPTGKRTAMLSLRSAVALAGVPLFAAWAGIVNPMFAVEGLVLNAVLLRHAYRFYQSPGDASARAVFRASLWYLPVLLALFVFHSRHWVEQELAQEAEDAAASGALPLPLPLGVGAGAAEDEQGSMGTVIADVMRHGVLVATDSLRHAGKAICVHETVKEARAGEASTAIAAALCPIQPTAVLVHGSVASPGRGVEEGEAQSGVESLVGDRTDPIEEIERATASSSSESLGLSEAEAVARGLVRTHCPVVVATTELQRVQSALPQPPHVRLQLKQSLDASGSALPPASQ